MRGIERATKATLEQVVPPTAADVAAHRATKQLDKAAARLATGNLDSFRGAVARFTAEHDLSHAELAAVLLAVAAGDDGVPAKTEAEPTFDRSATRRADHVDQAGFQREPRRRRTDGPAGPRYRVAVGRDHGVRPAGIVGAITGEGGIAGSDLGRIDIFGELLDGGDLRPPVQRSDGPDLGGHRQWAEVASAARHRSGSRSPRHVPSATQRRRVRRRPATGRSARAGRSSRPREPNELVAHPLGAVGRLSSLAGRSSRTASGPPTVAAPTDKRGPMDVTTLVKDHYSGEDLAARVLAAVGDDGSDIGRR